MVFAVYEYNVKEKTILICCVTQSREKATDAIDDYAMARLGQLDNNVGDDARPLDFDDLKNHNNGFFAVLDDRHTGPNGESERVNIIEYNHPKASITHYFSFQYADMFVDEALAKGSKYLEAIEEDDQANEFTTIKEITNENVQEEDDLDLDADSIEEIDE